MDPRDRLYGNYTLARAETEELSLDVGTLLTNLLLFDTLIIRSNHLMEIPLLIELFDYRGLMRLLKEGILQFHVDVKAFPAYLEPGSTSVRTRLQGGGPYRRLGHFNLSVLRIGEVRPSDFLPAVMAKITYLSPNRRNRLGDAVEHALLTLPEDFGERAGEQIDRDLDRTGSGLGRALQLALFDSAGRNPPLDAIRFRVLREGQLAVAVESNLTQLGLSAVDAHEVVGNALLALSALDVRLAVSATHDAITGATDHEAGYLDEKFSDLVRMYRRSSDPTNQQERFMQVIDLAGLPDLGVTARDRGVDVDRLLDIRHSPECTQFRNWLRTLNKESAAEAVEQIRSLRSRVGGTLSSMPGRLLRFGTLGLLGPLGVPLSAGTGLGFVDSFLLEKIFPHPGAAAFINTLYPSIFP